MDSAAHDDGALRRYGWETTLIAVIGIVIATLGLVTHLMPSRTPSDQSPSATSKLGALHDLPANTPGTLALPPVKSASQNKGHTVASSQALLSDPRVVVIGPNSIRGRFTLLGINRKPGISGSNELTLRLRVASLALPDLVTPYQSSMLEVRASGWPPIQPRESFSHPVTAGDSRDDEITFMIPADLELDRSTLSIHYFNEAKAIPLNLFSQTSQH